MQLWQKFSKILRISLAYEKKINKKEMKIIKAKLKKENIYFFNFIKELRAKKSP